MSPWWEIWVDIGDWQFVGWTYLVPSEVAPDPKALADRLVKGLAGQLSTKVFARNEDGATSLAQGWQCPQPMGLGAPPGRVDWL